MDIRGNNLFFAVSGVHVRDVLAHLPPTAVTFKGAMSRFPPAAGPSARLPRTNPIDALPKEIPELQVVKNGAVAKTVAAARALQAGIARRCTTCRGTGQVSVRIKTGTYSDGNMSRPTFSDSLKPCATCAGKGFIRGTDAVQSRVIAAFISSLAETDVSAPKAKDQLQWVQKMLRESIADLPAARNALIEHSRSELARDDIEPKTPMLLAGQYVTSIKLAKSEAAVVMLDGASELVLVSKPVLVDSVDSGSVLIGGLHVKTVKTNAGNRFHVLQDGCLIAATVNNSGLRRR
jgi:hypothetical protein